MNGGKERHMKSEYVKISEKIDLHLGKGPYYRTVVDDILDEETLLVSIPTFRGIPIILHMDQELQLFFYRDNGRFAQNVQVIGFDLGEAVRLVKLRILSEPARQQRRQSFRVSTILQATLRPYTLGPFPLKPDPSEAEEMEEVSTFNVSATGVAIKTHGDYYVGERIFLRIFLAWPTSNAKPLDIMSEVRQIVRLEPGRDVFYLGAMFLDASEEMSTHIAKFVLIEEQKRRKQARLVEEE